MNKIILGFQLAYHRKLRNWSQEHLAEIVECASCTISRIERGKQYPRVELYEKLCNVFNDWVVDGADVFMDDVSKLQTAKTDLLIAIHSGCHEKIERVLNHFGAVMDSENIEHQQYNLIAALVCLREKGVTIKEFKEKCVRIFERRRRVPKVEDIPKLRLSRIEHMILCQYAWAYFEEGYFNEAEAILKALLKNCFTFNNLFNRKRCISLSTNIAKISYCKKNFEAVHECVGFLIYNFVNSNDAKNIRDCLELLEKIYIEEGNEEAAEIVRSFRDSSARMINYLQYRMNANK
ncbi:MAG: helix-turn-helix transcriptional regulator [Pseudobutyrivibrio sp.]|nr:helix-turn-helix transcriptional regulator [Pseudobutyrivibrio sp.]